MVSGCSSLLSPSYLGSSSTDQSNAGGTLSPTAYSNQQHAIDLNFLVLGMINRASLNDVVQKIVQKVFPNDRVVCIY